MTRFTIRARSFRVLERLDWSPAGFCLLSGANGAGKSTVLDALPFLRTLFERGQEAALLRVDARYFRNVDVPEREPVVFELEVEDVVWKLRFPMAAGGIIDTPGEELYRGDQRVLHAEMFGRGWQLGEQQLTRDEVRCCAKVLWDRGDAAWMKPLVDAVTGIRVYESYELRNVKASTSPKPRPSGSSARPRKRSATAGARRPMPWWCSMIWSWPTGRSPSAWRGCSAGPPNAT